MLSNAGIVGIFYLKLSCKLANYMNYRISDPDIFKLKALKWAAQFEICAVFDSNNYPDHYQKFEFLVAAGANKILQSSENSFQKIDELTANNKKWLFGALSYHLKDEIEYDDIPHKTHNFSNVYFFEPQFLFMMRNGKLELLNDTEEFIIKEIESTQLENHPHKNYAQSHPIINKKTYLETVDLIKNHIARGDIYETNYCLEFKIDDCEINPVQIYQKLNKLSPTPFSTFFKWKDFYVLSATPERYLAKRGTKIISQPIKGTAARHHDPKKDQETKKALALLEKEQQENVMIVDLVRNDLTKVAKPGSVVVEELFGVYSFKQVHQLISTVVCEQDLKYSFADVIKHTFPMGSMTGAPKISAMKLMEKYEKSDRGLYSGAIGYIEPGGDFDFNVVIRSIIYQQQKKLLSYHVGSAITFNADANLEYEECLLKASAINQVLGIKI